MIVIVALQSCYYDKEELLYPEISSSCDTVNVTYSENISPIIEMNCLSCHSNSTAAVYGSDIKLENFEDIEIYVTNGQLLGSILQNSGYEPMPKGSGKMDDCKIKQFEIWISEGAINN